MDAATGNNNPATTTLTVKLNVGGKVYEVSKSLLESFPDTLLAKKASTETSSPIFIDRDPDRFAYVLDYMRDSGKVYLAETVTKAALLQELKFFGFVAINESLLVSDEWSKRKTAIRMYNMIAESRQRIQVLDKNLKNEKIALQCFIEFLKSTKDLCYVPLVGMECPFDSEITYWITHNIKDTSELQQCLCKYGIAFYLHQQPYPDYIRLKRLQK